MPTSPAPEPQRQSGAAVQEAPSAYLPDIYSSLAEEYEAATEAVGLVDRSYTGRLRVTGDDALDLLNRLSTNQLEDLAVGKGMHTVLTSNKGRILDLLFALRLDDHLLVLTGPENSRKVADWIDFYTFVEDVAVRDATAETAMPAMMGPKAAGLLDDLTEHDVSSLSPYESVPSTIEGVAVTVVRTDFAALPGYDIVAPASQAERLWTKLLKAGTGLGIKPVGMEALELVRVEQGVPVWGKELGEDINPLEANLLEFISFSKGCYIGQEVVTRLNTYKKVQKYLVGLSWDRNDTPSPNANLFLDGKKVGAVRSAVRSLRLDKGIGLAYVKKAYAQPGVILAMESAEGDVQAVVERLPFKT
jgi:folate-binding protein YgfZ